VAIGGSPSQNGKLHVDGSVNFEHSMRYYNVHGGNGTVNQGRPIGIYAQKHIACEELQVFSDRRIKTNIVDVPDDLALQQVRDIPCRYYEYIDKATKGAEKTIGFIAQEVREVLPMAVSIMKQYVPDEYRMLENISWEEIVDISGNSTYKLTTDLTDVSGINYKFMLSNDLSGNVVENVSVGNSDDTFTFDESYQHVFCYGKEVDDFHGIEKNKIFALHHSAIQEIDRQLQAEKQKVANLESQLASVLQRLAAAGI
jgi:hypothetical protein